MSVDKNQATINYLLTCPVVQNNPLFFNFATVKENNNQFITLSNDTILSKPYIDGSVLRRYSFTMATFKTVSYNPMVKEPGYPDENLTEVAEFQQLIDWLKEQADIHNYPDFGADCIIDNLEITSDNPQLTDLDTSVTPNIARYIVSINIDYLDLTKQTWR